MNRSIVTFPSLFLGRATVSVSLLHCLLPGLLRWLRYGAVFVAGGWVACAAVGDTVYRCGNVYSQVPCQDAETLEVEDPRTMAQRRQTDAAARTSAKLAREMEQERLALERKAAIQGRVVARPAAQTGTAPQEKPVRLTLKRIRPAKPGHFIAEIPGSRPESTPHKKSARKKSKPRSSVPGAVQTE